LEGAILRYPARFSLVERDEESWAEILREQELSNSDLADRSAALRIGKMLPAEMIVLTSLIPHDKGISVVARVLETAAGTRAWAGDIYFDESQNELEVQIDALAMKLKQSFPLFDAVVVGVSGDRIEMDAGAEKGVRPGTKLFILKTGPDRSKKTGKVLYCEDIPAEIEVTRAGRKDSLGRISPRGAAGMIEAGDLVCTR
jgi:hypothetical protein